MTIASLFSNTFLVIALVLISAGSVQAQTEAVTPPPIDRVWLRASSADPNAPRSMVGIDDRADTTTRLSMRVPLWSDLQRFGLFAHLLPLIELDGHVIPHLRWRARLAAEVGWARPLLPRSKWGVLVFSGGAMHESDHVTVPHGHGTRGQVDGRWGVRTFEPEVVAVVLNDLFVRAAAHVPRGDWVWSGIGVLRAHVLTCTVSNDDCPGGSTGSRTLELGAEMSGVRRRPGLLGVVPFYSAAFTWMGENDLAAGEWRLDLRAGFSTLRGAAGAWQLGLDVRQGHPIGVLRGVDTYEGRYGISVSWIP